MAARASVGAAITATLISATFEYYSDPAAASQNSKHIAAKLDALTEETQRLAPLYERKLAALEALKKSLLHQAFTGQL